MNEQGSIRDSLVKYLVERAETCFERGVSQLALAYRKAATSLRIGETKSGQPAGAVLSGKDAKKIKNIGPKLAKEIDRWFQSRKSEDEGGERDLVDAGEVDCLRSDRRRGGQESRAIHAKGERIDPLLDAGVAGDDDSPAGIAKVMATCARRSISTSVGRFGSGRESSVGYFESNMRKSRPLGAQHAHNDVEPEEEAPKRKRARVQTGSASRPPFLPRAAAPSPAEKRRMNHEMTQQHRSVPALPPSVRASLAREEQRIEALEKQLRAERDRKERMGFAGTVEMLENLDNSKIQSMREKLKAKRRRAMAEAKAAADRPGPGPGQVLASPPFRGGGAPLETGGSDRRHSPIPEGIRAPSHGGGGRPGKRGSGSPPVHAIRAVSLPQLRAGGVGTPTVSRSSSDPTSSSKFKGKPRRAGDAVPASSQNSHASSRGSDGGGGAVAGRKRKRSRRPVVFKDLYKEVVERALDSADDQRLRLDIGRHVGSNGRRKGRIAFGSAGYAILLVLYRGNAGWGKDEFYSISEPQMLKPRIVKLASQFYLRPERLDETQHRVVVHASGRYTGWSSMGTLVKEHGYVESYTQSRQKYFRLTKIGMRLAEVLSSEHEMMAELHAMQERGEEMPNSLDEARQQLGYRGNTEGRAEDARMVVAAGKGVSAVSSSLPSATVASSRPQRPRQPMVLKGVPTLSSSSDDSDSDSQSDLEVVEKGAKHSVALHGSSRRIDERGDTDGSPAQLAEAVHRGGTSDASGQEHGIGSDSDSESDLEVITPQAGNVGRSKPRPIPAEVEPDSSPRVRVGGVRAVDLTTGSSDDDDARKLASNQKREDSPMADRASSDLATERRSGDGLSPADTASAAPVLAAILPSGDRTGGTLADAAGDVDETIESFSSLRSPGNSAPSGRRDCRLVSPAEAGRFPNGLNGSPAGLSKVEIDLSSGSDSDSEGDSGSDAGSDGSNDSSGMQLPPGGVQQKSQEASSVSSGGMVGKASKKGYGDAASSSQRVSTSDASTRLRQAPDPRGSVPSRRLVSDVWATSSTTTGMHVRLFVASSTGGVSRDASRTAGEASSVEKHAAAGHSGSGRRSHMGVTEGWHRVWFAAPLGPCPVQHAAAGGPTQDQQMANEGEGYISVGAAPFVSSGDVSRSSWAEDVCRGVRAGQKAIGSGDSALLPGQAASSASSAPTAASSTGKPIPRVVVLVAHNEPKRTFDALLRAGVPIERATIPPGGGDLLWAVRVGERLYMTGHAAERKTAEDLTDSILALGGKSRYLEQKFYLWRSGLRRLMYILEGDTRRRQMMGDQANTALMALTADASTTAEGFSVWRTEDLAHTGRTVARLTEAIQAVAVGREASLPSGMQWRRGDRTFEAWCSGLKAIRNSQHSLGMVTRRMLGQVRGIKRKQVDTVTNAYPTYGGLCAALRKEHCAGVGGAGDGIVVGGVKVAASQGAGQREGMTRAARLLTGLPVPPGGQRVTEMCAGKIVSAVLGLHESTEEDGSME